MAEKKVLFLLLLFLTACLFLISGCIEKRECETSSDCVTKECRSAQCVEGKCVYNIIQNCCGNMRCEEGFGENNCTCPKDCEECKGRETFMDITGKEKETQYLSYVCIHNECVLDSERKLKTLSPDPKQLNYFTLGITLSFEQPFDVLKSSLKIKVDLKDSEEELVLPINFTKIRVLDKQDIELGGKDLNRKLEQVGDLFEEELNLLDGTKFLEETKYVTLKMEYYYSIREKTGRDEEGNPIYTPTKPEWKSFTYQFSDKLIFVNPRAR